MALSLRVDNRDRCFLIVHHGKKLALRKASYSVRETISWPYKATLLHLHCCVSIHDLVCSILIASVENSPISSMLSTGSREQNNVSA